jgi:predicted RNA methylase
MYAGAPRTYLAELRGLVDGGADAAAVVRGVIAALLDDAGVTVPAAVIAGAAVVPRPPDELRTPWLLGQVHETLLEPAARRRAGAHYTPVEIARGLVAFAREGHAVTAPRVCDPAAGGGAFLLAAAESLAADGLRPVDVVRRHCFGGDIDPLAAVVARASLAMWAGTWPDELDVNLTVSDALASSTDDDAAFDLVVGNPPFQNQLGRTTARSRDEAARLRARFGDAATGYVDTAALFLLRGLELVRSGGRVALVQPHSTLVARDARGVRAAVAEQSAMRGVWFTTERVFAAGVRVWAPVLERDGDRDRQVERRVDATFTPAPTSAQPQADDWASLVVDLAGVPTPHLRTDGVVGDLATATAGFRDQFYGLVGAVRDDEAGADPRLLTSGLIDVLGTTWGRVDARFAKSRYRHPRVALDGLAPDVGAWVRAQLRPKLVLATQTKVVEVAVDEVGDLVPSTPVIAVHAPVEQLWALAAAIGSPPVSALARQASFGAALSADAVKLSARQVLGLPLPADHAAWADATVLARIVPGTPGPARRRALEAYGAAACRAYGVEPGDLLPWWLGRIGHSGAGAE